MQAECSSVGECGIITENTAQGETTLAKKKPLKKDRKAGRGNLPAQKQPFYLQAQQQRKPKPKKQREDWDEPAIEPGEYPVSCDRMDEQGSGVVYLEGCRWTDCCPASRRSSRCLESAICTQGCCKSKRLRPNGSSRSVLLLPSAAAARCSTCNMTASWSGSKRRWSS